MITTAVGAEARKRNIERRRETSRFAARDRRGKEADIFVDLKEVVPVVNEATVTHVDRIALLRVAATLCRMRKTASAVLKNNLSSEIGGGVWCEDTLTECIDGFIIMADADGSILYVTESVSLFLGLTQTDLTGRSMKEFMHPADYDEYVKMQGELIAEDHADSQSTVFRLKTVISPRGRNLNLKSALFKPVSFLMKSQKSDGHQIILLQGCSIPAGQGSVNATASAITKDSGSETLNGTFMTRHTCDMRISYVSDTLNFILKNDTRSLMGTSFYDLVHPADAHIVHKSMRELFSKGHCRTPYYRLIAASNNLAWVLTEATTINHTTRGQKGQYVICIHYMLGMQGESESLVVCTDAMPAGVPVLKQIKTEIDDSREYMMGRQPEVMECVEFTPLIADKGSASYPNPLPGRRRCAPIAPAPRESRTSSYDDVLQWLFRDQPCSPPPEYRGRESNCGPGVQSPTVDPPLAAAAHGAGRGGALGGQPGEREFAFFSPQFSPLADGLAECKLRSSPNSSPPTNGNSESQSVRRGIGSVGVRSTAHTQRGVSAISPADPFSLCSAGRADGVDGLQSTMPPSNTLSPSAAVANAYRQANHAPSQTLPITDLDLSFEEPDLSTLAPFVSQEELQPISSDLPKVLFPDLPDLIPTEPLIPAAKPGSMSTIKTEVGASLAKRAAYPLGASGMTPIHHYEHSYMQPAFRVGTSQRTVYAGVQRLGSRFVSDFAASRELARVPVHQVSMSQHSFSAPSVEEQQHQTQQEIMSHQSQVHSQPQQGGWSMAYGMNSIHARQHRTVVMHNM